jgi:hypothetical protein
VARHGGGCSVPERKNAMYHKFYFSLFQAIRPGVDVMITIICDLSLLSVKKQTIFCKNYIKCFEPKNRRFKRHFLQIKKIITPGIRSMGSFIFYELELILIFSSKSQPFVELKIGLILRVVLMTRNSDN